MRSNEFKVFGRSTLAGNGFLAISALNNFDETAEDCILKNRIIVYTILSRRVNIQ